MTRLPLLFLLALPLVSACAQDNAKNLETVRPQLQTQSSVEGANPEVAQRSQALTAAEAGLVDRGANARPLASLEEKGAPAGTDELLNLIRAHHAEPAAIETRLAALEDPAASLLAIEANAVSMGERTSALRFMRLAPTSETRARLLDLLRSDDNHPAIQEAAALGLQGIDLNEDAEVKEALETAAKSGHARVQDAANATLAL